MRTLKIRLLNTATLELKTNQEGDRIKDIDVLKELREAYRKGKLENHIVTDEYLGKINSDWEELDKSYLEIDNDVLIFDFVYIALYDEKGNMLEQVEYK